MVALVSRPPRWEPAERTEPDADLDARLTRLAEQLAGRRVAVLTGAGISTASGIPDYRGPDSPQRSPMTVQQFLSSADFRRHYWARNHLGWRHMDAALPNAGHRALAALERAGVVAGVITQNVDLLHLKAGSRRVVDLHGSYGRVRCLSCGHALSRYTLADILEPLNADFVARTAGAIEVAPDADAVLHDTAEFRMIDCPACDGVLKPDIVYFGETVPTGVVAAAFALVDAAEALLVCGSSLTVASGLRFVRHAATTGRFVATINRGPTRGARYADVVIDADTSTALPALARLLGA